MSTTTRPVPDVFATDTDPDPLLYALALIESEQAIASRDADLRDRYEVLWNLHGIVDHTRRVLRGGGTSYQLEKAQVIVDSAARLVAELEEQLNESSDTDD